MFYAILALLIANIVWGAGAPIFKDALTDIPPFTLAFLRFFGAGIFLLPFILRNKKHLDIHDVTQIVIGAFFGITITISFFFLGLQRAPSTIFPIINSAGPIFLFLASILLFKEKVQKKVMYGMLISLFGIAVILFAPLFISKSGFNAGTFQGTLFVIIAVISGLIHPLCMKKVLKKIDPFVVTGYMFFFGALTFIPFMIWESNTWSITQSHTNGWLGIIYGIFGSSLLAYSLYNYGISKMKLQEVGIFSYISPVAAVIVAFFYNEYPPIYFYVGALLTFFGIFIAEEKIHFHKLHKKIQEK